MTGAVRLGVTDAVGVIRLDRPPVNALSLSMIEEIGAAAVEVSRRTDIRAVVIYGGRKVFAAGGDVAEMAGLSMVDMIERGRRIHAAFNAVAAIPQPVIAAINGYALGGGCELAIAADLRICATDAQLGQPEIRLGVIPGAGGTQRLPRLVGVGRAKDLIYTGRVVNADEAHTIGLVDRVVVPDDVETAALGWAASLAAGPPRALELAKAAIDCGLASGLDRGLEVERIAFAALFGTQDQASGMGSFLRSGLGGEVNFSGR